MPPFKLTQAANRERAAKIFDCLSVEYDATCTLSHRSPLQLLVATILAAQCTDKRVNIVTKDLFRKFRKAEDYLAVPVEELAQDIRTCGFYRQKAKSIAAVCSAIIEKHHGKVPHTMDDLLQLNGVGRKTANVILGQCFGEPAIIVDTHCTRLSRRMGFTKNTDAGRIERDLMKIWPREDWTQFSHCMVHHGRAVCIARAPHCSTCPIAGLCPFPHSREGKKAAR